MGGLLSFARHAGSTTEPSRLFSLQVWAIRSRPGAARSRSTRLSLSVAEAQAGRGTLGADNPLLPGPTQQQACHQLRLPLAREAVGAATYATDRTGGSVSFDSRRPYERGSMTYTTTASRCVDQVRSVLRDRTRLAPVAVNDSLDVHSSVFPSVVGFLPRRILRNGHRVDLATGAGGRRAPLSKRHSPHASPRRAADAQSRSFSARQLSPPFRRTTSTRRSGTGGSCGPRSVCLDDHAAGRVGRARSSGAGLTHTLFARSESGD
jgi:hypothetical protein